METNTKLLALTAGAAVYTVGYLTLLAAVLRGQLGGLLGAAVVLMATGILIAMVFGVLLARLTAEILGEP